MCLTDTPDLDACALVPTTVLWVVHVDKWLLQVMSIDGVLQVSIDGVLQVSIDGVLQVSIHGVLQGLASTCVA